MATTRELTNAFLVAAQALGDHMLHDLQGRSPDLAVALIHAFESGESLQLAFVINGEPSIELQARSESRTIRLVSRIPLSLSAGRRDN